MIPLRERVEALWAALQAAGIDTGTITLADVTVEEFRAAFPEADGRTYVAENNYDAGGWAIDSVDWWPMPGVSIGVSVHRAATAEELATLRATETPQAPKLSGFVERAVTP